MLKSSKRILAAVVCGAGLIGIPSTALAHCDTRHFYNNSTTTFTLTVSLGTCSLPNSANVHECRIPPAGTAEIHYADLIGDRITVASDDRAIWGNAAIFDTNLVCYIYHNGTTGNIVVNSDADGDIATCGPYHRDRWGDNKGYDCKMND